MNRMFLFLVLASLSILIGCQSDSRKSFSGDNFTIYFFDDSEAEIAKKIAFFWKENKLVSGNQQDLQVRKDKNRFTLSMIASDSTKIKDMPIDEVQLLAQLKKKLYVEVFNEESFTLEICNNRFEPIYTVE